MLGLYVMGDYTDSACTVIMVKLSCQSPIPSVVCSPFCALCHPQRHDLRLWQLHCPILGFTTSSQTNFSGYRLRHCTAVAVSQNYDNSICRTVNCAGSIELGSRRLSVADHRRHDNAYTRTAAALFHTPNVALTGVVLVHEKSPCVIQ